MTDAKDTMVKEVTEKILAQVAPMFEKATGGEIKIYKNKIESELAEKQAEAELLRRLEASPELLALCSDLKQVFEDEQAQAATAQS